MRKHLFPQAYTSPLSLLFLLKFLFNENELRSRVLSIWQRHYDIEYLEISILPQIQTAKTALAAYVTHLIKQEGPARLPRPSGLLGSVEAPGGSRAAEELEDFEALKTPDTAEVPRAPLKGQGVKAGSAAPDARGSKKVQIATKGKGASVSSPPPFKSFGAPRRYTEATAPVASKASDLLRKQQDHRRATYPGGLSSPLRHSPTDACKGQQEAQLQEGPSSSPQEAGGPFQNSKPGAVALSPVSRGCPEGPGTPQKGKEAALAVKPIRKATGKASALLGGLQRSSSSKTDGRKQRQRQRHQQEWQLQQQQETHLAKAAAASQSRGHTGAPLALFF